MEQHPDAGEDDGTPGARTPDARTSDARTPDADMEARRAAVRGRVPWYRDKRRRDRVALVVFAVLGTGSIVLAGSLQLAEGDTRVLVATMEVGAGQEARDRVKEACGDLPGISTVADRGEDDPVKQGRLPVRFAIGGASIREEAALDACLQRFDDVVRGVFREG